MENTTEPKGFCGLCGNPAYKCTCNTTSDPKPQDSIIKLKFTDNGVGPCSDCGSHVNINSEGPATGTKVLCPQCQGNYLHKDKVNDILPLIKEAIIDEFNADKFIEELKKKLGLDKKLFGMEVKVDKDLKNNEFRLE